MTLKDFLTNFVAPLLVLVIGAVILWFGALPAEYAKRNEQIKFLQESQAELKAKMDSALDKMASENVALHQRISDMEQRIVGITSINPMISECAEIMRQMREPGSGMGVMTLDKETNTLRDTRLVALSDRYNQLGCNSFGK
ncbi:hypothetical protein LOS78_06580 [Paracoccus sp. MA]|uniref:hypothetical protein n=1 Tax=Paracoccus sp. MA TaxID=2895796 RepID=UPI001E5D1A67|nr:hypothetical protein [Paracoccus sp. MA]UFM63828.1 hypothetical protein LOS78_06580 [Paracoccus sp. MA]